MAGPTYSPAYSVVTQSLAAALDRLVVVPAFKKVSSVTVIGLPFGASVSLHIGQRSDAVPLLAQGVEFKCCPAVESGIAVTCAAQGGNLVLLVTYGESAIDVTGGGALSGVFQGALYTGDGHTQNVAIANRGGIVQLANPLAVGGVPNSKLVTASTMTFSTGPLPGWTNGLPSRPSPRFGWRITTLRVPPASAPVRGSSTTLVRGHTVRTSGARYGTATCR